MKMTSREELLEYADREFHRSVLQVQPNTASEEHRSRLISLQRSRKDEMDILRGCETVEAVASTFVIRAQSGEQDETSSDAKFLGIPTLFESLKNFRARVLELRVASGAAVAAPIDAPSSGDTAAAREARQDFLLDEGIEETFPASDPVSVSHIT